MNVLFKRPFHAARETLARYDGQDLHTSGRIRAVVGGVLYADGLVGIKVPSDHKNQLAGILGSLAGMAVGLVFLVVGSWVVSSAADTDASTEGTVASVSGPSPSDKCSLSASFEVDGQTYLASSEVVDPDHCRRFVGEAVTVRYNSANPDENAVGGSSQFLGRLFVAIGAFALLASGITLAVGLASMLVGLRLLRSGRRMMADNPRLVDDDGVVEEAKRAVTNLLKRRDTDAPIPDENFDRIGAGMAGGLLGDVLSCPRTAQAPSSGRTGLTSRE